MSMKATKFSIAYILGYLMTHPDTLRDNKYRFDIRDFPTGLTQVVYMAINNCAQGGCTVVTPQELLATVENSAKATKIFTDSNGSQYINDCYGLGKEDKWGNFEYHYSLLKKQSLLLSFKAQGFNISELWTENPLSVELDEKQTANLEKLSIDDIINFFEKKIDIQRSFYSENEGQASIRASEGMQALVESLKATPEMGAPMNSKILNTIYRGARLGKLYMRSGSSGSGKSRLMLADACKVAIPYIYNIEEKNWTVNEFSAPTLFITTELEVEEIQTMIIAYVSGVDETHILDGKYEEGEEDRVHKAIAAINASPLYLEQVPSFNMEDIERVIRKHKTTNDVQYIFFDYVFISGKMITEMAQKSRGIKMREDNVLYLFMERMKFLCNKYHIHINTASQLNGEWKNVKTADETVLRGAKAMADKLDCGAIVLRVTELDKEMLAPILESTMYKEPNLVYNIYKVRRGRFTKVKLWVYFDYGTLRTQDLFVTTNEYEIIPIESTNLDQILEKYATSDFPLTLEEMGVASPNTEDNEEAMDDEDEAENIQPEEVVNNGGEDEVEW